MPYKIRIKILFKILVFWSIALILIYYLNHKSSRNELELELEQIIKIRPSNQYLESDLSHKFIVYSCTNEDYECGGWGDRLKGMISAYVWGQITNRTLLLKVNKPCDIIHLLHPNKIMWNKSIEDHYACLISGKNIKKIKIKKNKCQSEKSLTAVVLKLYENNGFRSRVSSLNLLDYYKDKDIIYLNTLNRNLLPSMAKNKYIKDRLNELGLDPQKLDIPYLFKPFYDKLFRLSPHLEQKHQLFLAKAKPTPSTKLICLHVRMGNKLLNHRMDLKFMASNDSIYFWRFTESIIKELDASEDYRIFLTTDTEHVEEEARKELDSSKIVTNEGEIFHMDRNDLKRDDCASIEKSVLDFHSLRSCDIALLSGSQFGMLGLWNRNNPFENIYMFDSSNKNFTRIKFEMNDTYILF
jgi:hypothetical protein